METKPIDPGDPSTITLPILTRSGARHANGVGAFGQVTVPLTNRYQVAHARAIGFWFGQAHLYQARHTARHTHRAHSY